MSAPVNNKYWQFRDKHGRNFKYQPEELWNEALGYFEWIENNSLKELKVFGTGVQVEVPKMRAMTITGFCLYADITLETFENYKANKDFFDIVTRIESIIREQKFTGAAAELLNPNIIARELGLSETLNQNTVSKTEITVTSKEAQKELDSLIQKFESE